MSQRVTVRLSSPGSAAFPRLLDGRKAHGRDGRTAKRPDGPARDFSPRPVIRGKVPPLLSSTSRAGQKGDFMARKTGLHRRRDSRFWWFKVVLPNGQRLRASTGTEDREEAEAYLAKLQHEAYRAGYLGVKPRRTWQEAVVRYLSLKGHLRDVEKQRRLCVKLDAYLGRLRLNGDFLPTLISDRS